MINNKDKQSKYPNKLKVNKSKFSNCFSKSLETFENFIENECFPKNTEI